MTKPQVKGMPEDLRGARILVVDDEKLIRESLVECLATEGFEAAGAGSGEEGVELAEKRAFDIVLCDMQLPGISGIETLERIDPLVIKKLSHHLVVTDIDGNHKFGTHAKQNVGEAAG